MRVEHGARTDDVTGGSGGDVVAGETKIEIYAVAIPARQILSRLSIPTEVPQIILVSLPSPCASNQQSTIDRSY